MKKQQECADNGCDLPARKQDMCLHHYIKAWKQGELPPSGEQGEEA